jgi:hypothetical protein
MVGAARPTEQSRVASALLRVAGGALLLGGVVTGYAAGAIYATSSYDTPASTFVVSGGIEDVVALTLVGIAVWALCPRATLRLRALAVVATVVPATLAGALGGW